MIIPLFDKEQFLSSGTREKGPNCITDTAKMTKINIMAIF